MNLAKTQCEIANIQSILSKIENKMNDQLVRVVCRANKKKIRYLNRISELQDILQKEITQIEIEQLTYPGSKIDE